MIHTVMLPSPRSLRPHCRGDRQAKAMLKSLHRESREALVRDLEEIAAIVQDLRVRPVGNALDRARTRQSSVREVLELYLCGWDLPLRQAMVVKANTGTNRVALSLKNRPCRMCEAAWKIRRTAICMSRMVGPMQFSRDCQQVSKDFRAVYTL